MPSSFPKTDGERVCVCVCDAFMAFMNKMQMRLKFSLPLMLSSLFTKAPFVPSLEYFYSCELFRYVLRKIESYVRFV